MNGYVRVQLKLDLVLANHTQRAFGQTNFTFLNVGTSGGNRICDVTHTDGAEQLAFFTSLGGNGD